jgi:putative nucleotidyltransferase with HDIG domain
LLDAVRIDVFERANMSPAAVPVLSLAFFFGPLGPIAGEALIAAGRVARREPLLKWSFDLGGLSLAGAAAAGVFALFPNPATGALLVVAAAAGAVYYAVNSGLLAIVMALSEGRSPLLVWSERLAWMVPHYVIFGLLAGTFVICEQSLGLSAFALFGLPMLMLWIAEKQYLDRSRSTVTELRAKNDELQGANQQLQLLLDENRELLGRMHTSYLSTITSLARTVEAKDPYTSGHTERVAEIAMLLAAELGIEPAELPAINVGAIIHDIGKIGIPDQILLKPGPLTEEETQEMRRHPEISSYIVAELELPPAVKQMVRSHHERYDGGGYPDKLAGEEIPLAARILTVADTLDAMTSDRPYRKALPLEVAITEIKAMAGSQFCPKVVAGLVSAMRTNPEFWSIFADEMPDSAPAATPVSPDPADYPASAGVR